MKTRSFAMVLMFLASGTIATAESSKKGPNLRYKPASLTLMRLPGVDVVNSETFTHFTVLDAQKIDFDVLKGKAQACLAGDGCGEQMTEGQVASFYNELEAATWEHEVHADRLVGVVETGPLRIFGRAADQVELSSNLLAWRGRCYPGNAQPQCPPQPPAPKHVWVGVLGVVIEFEF